jgi:hypothetical protein
LSLAGRHFIAKTTRAMTTRTSILSLSLLLSTAACGEDGPAMSAGGTAGTGGHADEGDDDAGHDTAGVDDDADGDAGRDGGDVDDGGDGGDGDDGGDDGHLVDRGDHDGGADGDHDGGADGGDGGDGWGDSADGGDAGDGRGDGWGDGGDAGEGGDSADGWGDGGDAGDADEGGDSGDGWGESGATCVPVDVPLLAGQTLAAGWVDISTVADGLRVEVQADAPWSLSLVHVYVGIDPPPSNAGGLIPGQFPYQALLDDASEYVLVVPWDVVGGACGEKVNVAVHAEVVQTLEGVIVEDETAWAKGPHSKGSDWSSWLEATLCCD